MARARSQTGSVQRCRLYVTQQKEYLVFRDACVGIRDRPTGRWLPVLPNRVVGSVGAEEVDDTVLSGSPPRVGERLCIQVQGRRVISAVVLSVESAAFPALSEG
jgi:hypothetical protein